MENFINGITSNEATVESVSQCLTVTVAQPAKRDLRGYLTQHLGKIVTLSTLKLEGKKIALIKGNRGINQTNLNKKVISIKENGLLVPIIIIPGEALINEGATIIDIETGTVVPIELMSSYVAVVEGQHRLIASYQINAEAGSEVIDPSFMYALPSSIPNSLKLMEAMNSEVIVWDGKDGIVGAYNKNQDNDLLKFSYYLSNIKRSTGDKDKTTNGYPLSTISLYCCFSNKLDKQILIRSRNEGINILPSSDIERANKIITRASQTFNHKYLSKRYFIQWVIDECTKRGGDIDSVLSLLDKVTSSFIKELYKTRSYNDVTSIRRIIYEANGIAE